MDLGFESSVVAITGASRGLGRALALAFAGEGATVSICGRNRDALQEVAGLVEASGGTCNAVVADLSSPAGCEAFVASTVARFGTIDSLICNASTAVSGTGSRLEDFSDDQIASRFLGKTLPAIRCIRSALPVLRLAGGGRIVIIGGTSSRAATSAGQSAGSGMPIAQGIGNAALSNFAKQLADEVARSGILINVVSPHIMNSGRHAKRLSAVQPEGGLSVGAGIASSTPIGRIVEMSDVVPIVLLLASRVNGAMTGQNIAVDGGVLRNIAY